MKNKIIIMLISTALIACNNTETTQNEEVIGKSNIQVTGGILTPEVMHSMGKVGDPQISPDGKKILYGVSYTSISESRSNRELFVMNLDGSDNTKITNTPAGESSAVWYGEDILFSKGGQLWKMKSDGTGAVQVSNYDKGISGFAVSPAGDKILFISMVKSAKKAVDIWPDIPKATGIMTDNLMYRHWDQYVEEIPHPFVADFNGTALSNIYDILEGEPYEAPALPNSGIEQLSWSPDGKSILYASRKLVGKEYAFSTNTDIYLYDIATRSHRNLTQGMGGYDTDPVYSPDGKYFAWLSMERPGFEADKSRLFIMNIATGEKRDLTKDFAYNAGSHVWLPDGSGIYFNSTVKALKGVYLAKLADGSINAVTPRDWYDFDKVSIVGDKLITTYKSMSMPVEIVSIDAASGRYTQITNENKHLLDKITFGKVEERWIKTVDNKDMHMWVVYPPNFDPAKKYPALLFCLGGPQGTISQGWSYRWNYQVMASQGYIVILPNRRGTTAFGQAWTDQISGDYSGLNIQDYISSVKEMQKEKFVGKVGAVGASYGGYSVYYLAGMHKKMFSAFVAHAGIFNQEHMYLTTEESWFPQWDNGGAPWDNNPIAKKHYANSPHTIVKNWDTPILITHGEKDYRVPVDQGMAAFNAAQMLGVPSEMLIFPDENHWILKVHNSLQWNRVFFRWLDKWLK